MRSLKLACVPLCHQENHHDPAVDDLLLPGMFYFPSNQFHSEEYERLKKEYKKQKEEYEKKAKNLQDRAANLGTNLENVKTELAHQQRLNMQEKNSNELIDQEITTLKIKLE